MVLAMRNVRYRFVMIVAALTMIATSAADPFAVGANADVAFEAGAMRRVRVVYNDAANEQAERMTIIFKWQAPAPVTIVPDDPALPAMVANEHTFQVLDVCVEAGPCELGFTIDASESPGGRLLVNASAQRTADQSFCFPDNRDFSDDAAVEVFVE
jgi:hypothetical protein